MLQGEENIQWEIDSLVQLLSQFFDLNYDKYAEVKVFTQQAGLSFTQWNITPNWKQNVDHLLEVSMDEILGCICSSYSLVSHSFPISHIRTGSDLTAKSCVLLISVVSKDN